MAEATRSPLERKPPLAGMFRIVFSIMTSPKSEVSAARFR
jgi:hypothetical protein